MRENVYTTILKDSDLQAKLMLVFKKSYSTIRKWALDKNEMLTTNKAQLIIKEHLNIEIAQTIELIKDKMEKWQYDSGENETE